MTKILDVLRKFLKEVENDNPFNLVLKGGTALAIYYLNDHRESEDLDFDVDKSLIKKHEEIIGYFVNVLGILKQKQIINNFRITKQGFASTDRYHIKLEIETYKTFYTKIDVDFVDLPKKLVNKDNLFLYSSERIFVTKAITFISRKEFKDLYDLFYLVGKIDVRKFKNKENVVKLIEEVIAVANEEDILKLYRSAFRNVDMKFKNLKESQLDSFLRTIIRKLRVLINKLKK